VKVDLQLALQEAIGLNDAELSRLIARSPYTYKVYTIPKKSGGVRTIAQPAKETKYLQYWLMSNFFGRLPVHSAAAAYKPGASVKGNALVHAGHAYISKFDFKGFFPSIKISDLVLHLAKHFSDVFSSTDLRRVARISCISPGGSGELCLSIGAPSSPVLSNSVMFEFDELVSCWCAEKGFSYTRYADDLTFSTSSKGISSSIEPMLLDVLARLAYPKIVLNSEKTIHVSKKHQRRVTGVVLNNEGSISIGREKKRLISVMIHKFSLGALPTEEVTILQGLLGFAKDIEPNFVDGMIKKYGLDVVLAIFKTRK